MKNIILTIGLFIGFTYIFGSIAIAEDSLFPTPEETAQNTGSSLNSAITQFDRILEEAPEGEMKSLNDNSQYNQQKIAELEKKLVEKRKYLESLPDLVSRQFELMMQQYENADQAKKDQIANELKTKWGKIQLRTEDEIKDLENQLEQAKGRLTDTQVQAQMLSISTSLSNTDKTLGSGSDNGEAQKQQRQYKDAFEAMQSLSSQRILSKIHAICVIQVKPLETDFSVNYLNK